MINTTSIEQKQARTAMLKARVAERIDATNKKIAAVETPNDSGDGVIYHHRSIAELLTAPGAIPQETRDAACKLVVDGLRAKIEEAQAEDAKLDAELAEWIAQRPAEPPADA